MLVKTMSIMGNGNQEKFIMLKNLPHWLKTPLKKCADYILTDNFHKGDFGQANREDMIKIWYFAWKWCHGKCGGSFGNQILTSAGQSKLIIKY